MERMERVARLTDRMPPTGERGIQSYASDERPRRRCADLRDVPKSARVHEYSLAISGAQNSQSNLFLAIISLLDCSCYACPDIPRPSTREMSEREVPEHAETRSSSFPISSPTFWNEAAKVSTPPPPSKRERSPEDEGRNEDEGDEGPAKRAHHRSPTTTLAYLPNRTGPIDVDDPHAYLVNAEYAPNRFGDIGDYMRKKEIKVQTQNRDIAFASAASGRPQIFAGLSFYINGNTHPPMVELRKMILQRGGEVRPVLRSKGMVKFIIAPMLTQSKFKQFERYRVVREGWITESCKEEKLLDWSRWKLKIIGGWEEGSKKGMEGFLKGQAILKGQASQMREAIKEDDLEDDTPPPPDPALPVPALPHQLLSASNRSLLVTPRSSPIPISSGIVRDLTANDRPGAKLESPPTPARSSPLASPTKDELIAHDETLRPPKTATIPISPGAVRGETPAKEKTPAKVHKPEGAWEYYYSKESNEDAARLLKNQEWRLKNTAERGNEGGFIDGYYQNSR